MSTDPNQIDNAELRNSNLSKCKGYWSADNRPGSDWDFAHEAGHLMCLDDDYIRIGVYDSNGIEITKPKPTHEGHMMAEWGGAVNRDEIDTLVRQHKLKCPCDSNGSK